jgi:hypothetical protein
MVLAPVPAGHLARGLEARKPRKDAHGLPRDEPGGGPVGADVLPSLLDTADELKAVAGKLGAAAGDVHLGNDASETVWSGGTEVAGFSVTSR